jgi:hypothetical protein
MKKRRCERRFKKSSMAILASRGVQFRFEDSQTCSHCEVQLPINCPAHRGNIETCVESMPKGISARLAFKRTKLVTRTVRPSGCHFNFCATATPTHNLCFIFDHQYPLSMRGGKRGTVEEVHRKS